MKKVILMVTACLLFLFSGISWSYSINGLISYYSFDDPANPTQDDANGHDGINYGAEYVNGRIGYGFQFDGSDYIDIGEGGGDFDLYENSKMTIAMWVKPENPDNPPDFWQFELLNKIEQNIYDGWHFNLGVHHGAPVLPIGFAKHDQDDAHSPAIGSQDDFPGLAFDQWYHLVALIDGPNSVFYVNGVEIDTIAYPDIDEDEIDMDSGDANNERHLFIGSQPNPIYRTYATIDEVFIYGRALADPEIQELWGDGGGSGGGGQTAVPEPATMLLLGSGLIGFAGTRRKFKK